MSVQIAILGPLEVRDDEGAPVSITGARLRTLLTALAVDAGHWVSTGTLADDVWDGDSPADEANALQTLVSRLRRALGDPAAVESSAAGYRLGVEPEAVDATRFETLLARASEARRADRQRDALDDLETALGLWRGPLPETPSGRIAAAATRLAQLRTRARTQRAELRVATGGADLAEIESLAADNPLDERLAVLLMRVLAGTGRQADALQAYERLRARLADELGVDPSSETQAAHLELLRGETRPAPTEVAPPPARRTNLRVPLTSFVGRDVELEQIGRLIGEHRLVTLVGPGGAGKTRLATEAARGLLPEARDGVWLAELSAATTGTDVAPVVLGAIGVPELHSGETAQGDATSRLRGALATRQLVIVLDNCEHVIDAAAALADALLGDCPDLRVLATSREPLGIGGETLFPVPPLSRPDDGADTTSAGASPAVALFADRAVAVSPGFVLDDSNVGSVVEIVRRLDGLPLAIELAAARLRSIPLEEIATRLSDRFRLLTGGSRTALPRHRTLRAVVEWSWDLLGEHERALIEQLAVFPAGVTGDSAEAVCPDGIDARDVPDLLASLVDKSLLQPIGNGRRLRMLETIREFGIERLVERGALGEARDRHARYFADVLADAVPRLTTRDQLPSFALLRAEQENVLAAMRFFVAADVSDTALQIAVDLSLFALLAGTQEEATGWLAEALVVTGGDARLRTLARAARVASADFIESPGEAMARDELSRLADELALIDPSFSPLLAMLRPGIAFVSRDIALAHRLIEEARSSADPWIRATSLLFETNLYENEGEIAPMRAKAGQALAEFRALGERWGIASSLRTLGQVRTLDGDLDAAAAAYAESMELMNELSSEDDTVFLLRDLADLARRRGDITAARGYLDRATDLARRSATDFDSLMAWLMVAELERSVGSRERARELAEFVRSRAADVSWANPLTGYVRGMLFNLLSILDLEDGRREAAQTDAEEAYAAVVRTQDLPVIASSGVFCAIMSERDGDAPRAATILGAADRLRGTADATSPEIATLTERLHETLGEDFDRHYARGRAMGRDEAIAALDPSTLDAGSVTPPGAA